MTNPFSTLPAFLRSSQSSFGNHENALKSYLYCVKEFLEILETSFPLSPSLLLMICTDKAMLEIWQKNFSLRLSKAPHLHHCFEMLLTVLPLLHRKDSFFPPLGRMSKGFVINKRGWEPEALLLAPKIQPKSIASSHAKLKTYY